MIVYGLRPASTFADRPFDASLLGPIASEGDRNARRSSGYGEVVRARTVRYVDAQVLPGRQAGPAEDLYAEAIAEALNPTADAPAQAEAKPERRQSAPRSEDSKIAKALLKGYDQAAWQGTNGIREWALRNGWTKKDKLPERRIILAVLYAWTEAHPHLRKTHPYAGQKRGPRDRNRGARA
jgi:hypothetical protein